MDINISSQQADDVNLLLFYTFACNESHDVDDLALLALLCGYVNRKITGFELVKLNCQTSAKNVSCCGCLKAKTSVPATSPQLQLSALNIRRAEKSFMA